MALQAVENKRFISFVFDQPIRKAIDQIFRRNKATIHCSTGFDNIEIAKRAVEIEDGISIVPLTTVDEERRLGSLVAVEIESADMWRPISLIQHHARSQPTAAYEICDNVEEVTPCCNPDIVVFR